MTLERGGTTVPTKRDLRSKRPRPIPSRTIHERNISRRELALGAVLYPDVGDPRPRRRGECVNGMRPCPFVACRHHLYLDVVGPRRRSIKLNFPDLEPEQMAESCSLDVADRRARTIEQVGALMNLTRERVRQIEIAAKGKAASALLKVAGDAQ